MSNQFKVGEIVIVQNDPAITPQAYLKRLDGEEVEVVGAFRTYLTVAGPFASYAVHHPAAGIFYCAPHELRRRRPPTTGEQAVRAMFDAPSKSEMVTL